jgi:hypothetical protein
MLTVEIDPADWQAFFQMLNSRARDRPVRLEVEGRELGDQEMGQLLPFHEMDIDPRGSERGKVQITVGSDHGELTHRIDRPLKIYAIHNDTTELEVVEIEDADQGKTLIYFQQLPEITDQTTPAA